MSLDDIIQKVVEFKTDLIEITGGEPLLQKNVIPLMEKLCDLGKKVLIETSGAHDISKIDARVIKIMDLKCPSSGESARNLWSNLSHLRSHDEIKFVIGSREDFEWARDCMREYTLDKKVQSILFSPVFKTQPVASQIKGHPGLESQQLVDWILQENLPVRMQIQIHKFIWEPMQRGV
jgi:7-carboxy-7-deazaguanine synthase